MRLFLIRHGETVDNVAGLYAGSRDSALTNHGIEQARRLGKWLSDHRLPLSHIFASPLQRAHKTAEALQTAQNEHVAATGTTSQASIVKSTQLVEQDFGYYEGKPFYARQHNSPRKPGRETHREIHKDDPGFVDVESKESLAKRSDEFLDTYLLPLTQRLDTSPSHVVAIVSHGILLSHLWRRLLLRFPARSVTIAPEVVASRGQVVLEHLGGWSNTGYLEVLIERATARIDFPGVGAAEKVGTTSAVQPRTPPAKSPLSSRVNEGGDSDLTSEPRLSTHSPTRESVPANRTRFLNGYVTTILTIDGKQHLQGLKRTRGGIGRSQYDEKQKTVDSFFKRAKKE